MRRVLKWKAATWFARGLRDETGAAAILGALAALMGAMILMTHLVQRNKHESVLHRRLEKGRAGHLANQSALAIVSRLLKLPYTGSQCARDLSQTPSVADSCPYAFPEPFLYAGESYTLRVLSQKPPPSNMISWTVGTTTSKLWSIDPASKTFTIHTPAMFSPTLDELRQVYGTPIATSTGYALADAGLILTTTVTLKKTIRAPVPTSAPGLQAAMSALYPVAFDVAVETTVPGDPSDTTPQKYVDFGRVFLEDESRSLGTCAVKVTTISPPVGASPGRYDVKVLGYGVVAALKVATRDRQINYMSTSALPPPTGPEDCGYNDFMNTSLVNLPSATLPGVSSSTFQGPMASLTDSYVLFDHQVTGFTPPDVDACVLNNLGQPFPNYCESRSNIFVAATPTVMPSASPTSIPPFSCTVTVGGSSSGGNFFQHDSPLIGIAPTTGFTAPSIMIQGPSYPTWTSLPLNSPLPASIAPGSYQVQASVIATSTTSSVTCSPVALNINTDISACTGVGDGTDDLGHRYSKSPLSWSAAHGCCYTATYSDRTVQECDR